MKPVVRHARADEDVQEAIAYYIDQPPSLALTWIDTLEATILSIRSTPGAGAARYGVELNIAGLRYRRCGKFPYLVFYVENLENIAIWRVLNERRDIPAWLSDSLT